MQLRHKFFIALSLITALPLLILIFGVVDRTETELSKRTEKELSVTLDKMADEINLILGNQKAIARGLASVPVVRAFASVANKPVGHGVSSKEYQSRADALEQFFLSYQQRVQSIQALRYIDKTGKTIVKVKEGKPIEPRLLDKIYHRYYVANQSRKTFFKRSISANKDVVMSNFELGQVTKNSKFCPAMVRYSALMKDELGNVEGLVVVNMWGNRLDSTIQASLGGYPGAAYLVEISNNKSRDGIYLYNRDSNKRFANQLHTDYLFTNYLSPGQWQKVRNGAEHGSLVLKDGRIMFYRILRPYKSRPGTAWLLLIQEDRSSLFAPIEKARKSIWLLLGVLLLVSLPVSVWAAWQLARPVNSLAKVITAYADGDHDIRYRDDRKDEIGHAGKAFNYMAMSLQAAERERDEAEALVRQSERLASLGQLAAGIGHEINNPLMNIMSLASLIEESLKDNQQAKSDIQLLQQEGQRCARIVQGILSFARESKTQYTQFDLSALIEDTLSLLQHKFNNADISIHTGIERQLVIYADANQLQQVLVNVILNAVQASPENGSIQVKAYRDIDYVAVEIIDTGTGIEEHNLTRIFDPFFTTKGEGKGTGLGLSVSYGIVKHHGGTIYVENNAERGLRVVILLPFKIPSEKITKQLETEYVV